MNKILIIEDDYFSAKRLKRLILDIDDAVEIHGPLGSVNKVVEELTTSNDYDLIFSDSVLLMVTYLKHSVWLCPKVLSSLQLHTMNIQCRLSKIMGLII